MPLNYIRFPIHGHIWQANVDGMPPFKPPEVTDKAYLSKLGIEVFDPSVGNDFIIIDSAKVRFLGIFNDGQREELFLGLNDGGTLFLVRDFSPSDETVRQGYFWGIVNDS